MKKILSAIISGFRKGQDIKHKSKELRIKSNVRPKLMKKTDDRG